MSDWKTRFMKLVLDGETRLATSVMKEHLVSDADIIDGINALSAVAINNMDDQVLVEGLAQVTKNLEENLK